MALRAFPRTDPGGRPATVNGGRARRAGLRFIVALAVTAGLVPAAGASTGIRGDASTRPGAQPGVVVNAGAAASLRVSGYPPVVLIGTTHPFTVTALDAGGNTATGYRGTVEIATADGVSGFGISHTFTAGDAGAFTFNLTFIVPGPQSISATDTADSAITGSQDDIQVVLPPTQLEVTGFAAPATAGTEGTITVTALDWKGLTCPVSTTICPYESTVRFASSDPQAVLPPDYLFTAADGATKDFPVTFRTAGTQSVTVTDKDDPRSTGTLPGIAVNPGNATSLRVSGFPSPALINTEATFIVTALDEFGNTATGYRGTVEIATTDIESGFGISHEFTEADAGTFTFTLTFIGKGPQSITATDMADPSITGSQDDIRIDLPPTELEVTGFGAPVTAGTEGTITVTARDWQGLTCNESNTICPYLRTVRFTSSDPQAVLPADYSFTSEDTATKDFTVTFKTAGTQSVTVTDTGDPLSTGSKAGITVHPAAVSALVVGGLPTPRIAGTAGAILVRATDAFGNTVTGYRGAVHFTSSDTKAVLPATYAFTMADAGSHTFTIRLKRAGVRSVTATDTVDASLTGTQSGIVVTPAAAVRFLVSGYPNRTVAGVAHSVTVRAVDASGNTATGYRGTIRFTSNDSRAVLPARYRFKAADGGKRTFRVTFRGTGTRSVTAIDTVKSSVKGTQFGIVVRR